MYCFFVFFKNFDSTSIVIRCSDFYFCFLTLDHGKKLNDTLNIQTVAIQSSNIYIYIYIYILSLSPVGATAS